MKWIKATRSNSSGNCVEFARVPNEDSSDQVLIRVRDSKDHGAGPELEFTQAEIAAMLDGAKAGEFDHLLVD